MNITAKISYTPGPWRIGVSCDHTPAVVVPVPTNEGSGFVVAHINRLPRLGSVLGNMDANARLIAAAPELLEALRGFLLGAASEKGLSKIVGEDVIRDARAAIAKAEGAGQ